MDRRALVGAVALALAPLCASCSASSACHREDVCAIFDLTRLCSSQHFAACDAISEPGDANLQTAFGTFAVPPGASLAIPLALVRSRLPTQPLLEVTVYDEGQNIAIGETRVAIDGAVVACKELDRQAPDWPHEEAVSCKLPAGGDSLTITIGPHAKVPGIYGQNPPALSVRAWLQQASCTTPVTVCES